MSDPASGGIRIYAVAVALVALVNVFEQDVALCAIEFLRVTPRHAYDSVSEAKQQLASYFEFYNTRRPHSSLGGQTPDTAYCGNGEWKNAA